MQNPPQIEWAGPANALTVPTNLVRVDADSPLFRFSGAQVSLWDNSYPHDLFFISSGITGTYSQLPYQVAFDADGFDVGILTLGTLGEYRLKINGQYASLAAIRGPPADGCFYWLKLRFATSERRTIRMESLGQAFGGVAVNLTNQIFAVVEPLGRRCIVIGDSYAEGLLSYAQRLAGLTSWEVWGSGVGGTGYLNTGPSGRVKFRDRVESDVIEHHPDIVIVAGGLNDSSYAPAAIQAEAEALYDTILTNLPSSKLIVVGPWWPRGNPSQSVLDTRDALLAAASSRHLDFIDSILATNVQQINAGWITGTGNQANPRGDGNADYYISEDGTHPTDLGHQYLATRLASSLKNLSIPDPTPTLNLQRLIGVQLSGTPGRSYLIQWRSDLTSNWVDAVTLTLSSTQQLWIDLSSTNSTRRYYRSLLLP